MENFSDSSKDFLAQLLSNIGIRNTLIKHRIRESQWFLPFCGGVLGVLLSLLVAQQSEFIKREFPGTAWRVTASEARNILLAFVGIEITALSIVMSLTMITIQNAANQFSPRLLRVYLRDWVQQIVLAVISGSTAYFISASVIVRLISGLEPTPQPIVGLAVFLIPISGIALVMQINHTLQVIRIEVIMHKVAQATIKTSDFLQELRENNNVKTAEKIHIEPWAIPVNADTFGYVIQVQIQILKNVAENHNCTIRIDTGVGEPVVSGTPVGWIQPQSEDEEISENIIASVRAGIGIDKWRDPTYDIALGIRQLVDVAIKALSPSINDPRTAVESVDHLSEILVHLAGYELGDGSIYGRDRQVLVQVHAPDLFGYTALATDQISRYGRHEPSVVLRLIKLCADVGLAVTCPDDKKAITDNLWSIVTEAEKSIDDPYWLDIIHLSASDAEEQINTSSTPENRLPADL